MTQEMPFDPDRERSQITDQKCQRAFSKFNCVAVVRSGNNVFPILQLKDGRFFPSFPSKFREGNFKPKPKKLLSESIQNLREDLHRNGFISSVEYAPPKVVPTRETANRKRNTRFDADPGETTLERRVIDPNIVSKIKGGNYAQIHSWVNKIEGITMGEELLYGWLAWRSDEKDGICRKAISEIAEGDMNRAPRTVAYALKGLRERRLIDYETTPGKVPEIRFLWHPAMPSTYAKNAQVSVSTCAGNAEVPEKTHAANAEDLSSPIITSRKPTRKNDYSCRAAESELFDLLGERLGEAEMKKNGGAWRNRIRADQSALRSALGELKIALDQERNGGTKVRNRAAWLVDKWGRFESESTKSDETESPSISKVQTFGDSEPTQKRQPARIVKPAREVLPISRQEEAWCDFLLAVSTEMMENLEIRQKWDCRRQLDGFSEMMRCWSELPDCEKASLKRGKGVDAWMEERFADSSKSAAEPHAHAT